MSKDIKLSHACPHLAVEDVAILSSDKMTVVSRQSIASEGSVYLLVDNDFYVPRNGLYSQASLHSSISGPYLIQNRKNVLTIESNTNVINITLPLVRVSTDDLSKIINSETESIRAENFGGYLVISDTESFGKDSKIKVSGSSIDSLGFSDQYMSMGKEVYPGWGFSMVNGPMGLSRFVKFNSVVKGNPTIKLTYSMPSDKCLRCGGTLAENDWRFDGLGDLVMIENEDLLYQASMKMILTTKTSNPFHQWYGSELKSRIGMKISGAVVSMIQEDVRYALNTLQRTQSEQSKYQNVSFKERLSTIKSVQVKQHEQDPTMFLVDVNVTNASREPVNISIVFTVPGVFSVNSSRNISIGRIN